MAKKPTLDQLFGGDGQTEESAAAAQQLATDDSVNETCKKLLLVRKRIDVAKAELKELSQQEENLEGAIMGLLDQMKLKSLKLEGGEQFTIAEKDMFSLPPQKNEEERKQAILWLKRVGAGELFKEDIHAGTLGSFLKERIEAGKKISELIVKFTKRTLSVTGTKKST